MTTLWAGLGAGAVYALVALTFNIPLAASGVFNFAQPQFTMLGGFLAFEGLRQGWPLLLVLGACVVVGGLLGVLEERVAIRPFVRNTTSRAALVTTVGFAVVLEGVAHVIWGTTPQAVPFPGTDSTLDVAGGRLGVLDLTVLILAVVACLSAEIATRTTGWGLANRATTIDPTAAELRGIDVTAVRRRAFALAGALACAVGPLVAAQVTASVTLGNNLLILAFVALCLGGFGSHVGCLVGGVAVGLVQALGARYLNGDWALVLLFAVLVALLLARPSGLFGARRQRTV
ncbi:branched-chain amino acid ABC transporter permease [Pseudonocardia ailaonensis]|uniref:Branched-chain amino acid ABC transporter permease n=1 Tax=Pseudonocardia ailaonensis TaxID=367279 RepID=A0ABN2N4M0_9PSEU